MRARRGNTGRYAVKAWCPAARATLSSDGSRSIYSRYGCLFGAVSFFAFTTRPLVSARLQNASTSSGESFDSRILPSSGIR